MSRWDVIVSHYIRITLMRHSSRIFFLLLLSCSVLLIAARFPPSDPDERNRVLISLINNILSSRHYDPKALDDSFSETVFDEYMEDLDFGKRFLLASDVEALAYYSSRIDEEMVMSGTELFDSSTAVLIKRQKQAESWVNEWLSAPFDYEKGEFFEFDGSKRSYAKSQSELKEVWRKYLKSRVLSRVYERLSAQEKDTADQRSFEEIEQKARSRELELQKDWFESMRDMREEDWMGVYMNAITGYFDPHTEYFPPQQKEEFEIQMSGQFEGIGAQLKQGGEFVTIEKIISGSASWRQGELEPGDKIVKVAQGDQEPVDVVGMKLRKVVKLIRGPKGTEVRLTVRKLDGTNQVIPIVRDVVELEATFAKSAVIGPRDGNDRKMGYIRLPKFYVDFYNENNRNCAEDVRAEIEKLKKDSIEGLILDLRNNGGGSLDAVVKIVGLFIPKGPVVQVKTADGRKKVLRDSDPDVAYDGPLVVMVNEFSASASEICAAALQDYGRAVIVGSETTFGKGTVQNIYNLDRATMNARVKPLGALKITIQKYYRIDGGTTQLKGVEPDLVMPDAYMDLEFGEKKQRHPMSYDEIGSARFDRSDKWSRKYRKAVKVLGEQMQEEAVFDSIRMHAAYRKRQQDLSWIPLDLDAYSQQEQDRREEAKKFKGLYRLNASDRFEVGFNAVDDALITEEKDREDREKWHENLGKDLYLYWSSELISTL